MSPKVPEKPGEWFEKTNAIDTAGWEDKGARVWTDNPESASKVFGENGVPTADSFQTMFSGEGREGAAVEWKPSSISVRGGYEPRCSMSGVLRTRDGATAGSMERTFTRTAGGELHVYHSLFRIELDALKGKGIANDVMRKSFRSYLDMGVTEVGVSTAWDGNVVWAKMGFDWKDPGQRRSAGSSFRSFLRSRNIGGSGPEGDKVREALSKATKHAFTLANTTYGKWTNPKTGREEPRPVGVEFLKTFGWSGKMKLKDGQPGYEYMKRKLKL